MASCRCSHSTFVYLLLASDASQQHRMRKMPSCWTLRLGGHASSRRCLPGGMTTKAREPDACCADGAMTHAVCLLVQSKMSLSCPSRIYAGRGRGRESMSYLNHEGIQSTSYITYIVYILFSGTVQTVTRIGLAWSYRDKKT